MMTIIRKHFITILTLFLPVILNGQSLYDVGHACRSVEPGDEFFSLALLGYGHPAEGRFSLEWEKVGDLPVSEPLSLFGDVENLYALALNGDLYREDNGSWNDVGSTNPVVLLAGSDPNSFKLMASSGDDFYSISLLNGLSSSGKSSSLSWIKHGKTPDAIALSASENALYIAAADGRLFSASIGGGSFEWADFPAPPVKTISLSYHNGRLYSLGENQQIWMTDVDSSSGWMKIAWLNGQTFKYPIKYIAVSGGKLFGFGFDGALYRAHNRTENNLFVNAVAISDSKSDVILMNLDSGAIDHSLVQRIKDAIFHETGVNPSNILFNVTHTHFAPAAMDWIMFPGGIADRRYVDLVVRQSVGAAKEAYESRVKSKLTISSVIASVGYNRGLTAEDAITDDRVDMILAEPISGAKPVLIVEAACHPVFPNENLSRFTLSANYPGVLRKILNDDLNVKTVFFQGCCGDINPLSSDYHETAIGIATSVEEGIGEGNSRMIKGRIRSMIDSVAIPVNLKTREEIMSFWDTNRNRTLDIEAEKNVKWAEHMLELYDSGDVPSTMKEYFQIIDIGNWRIIGLSREPVSSYAMRIRDLWPGKDVTVVGYSNDISSYLPDEKHIMAGTYESSDSFLWYGAPSSLPSDTYERILGRIAARKQIK